MAADVGPREAAVDLGAGPGPIALLTAASLDAEALSPEALLDTIAGLEASLAWAAAVRSRFIAEYASRAPVDPRDQVEDQQMEWHREQLAAATRTSPHEAHVRCETALALRDRLPATAAALTAGALPWAQAVVLAHETRALDPTDSARVERQVLPDPRAVSVRQVARATRAAVERLRPTAVADEAATAWQLRSLVTWPARDGIVALHAELPVDAAALLTAAIEPLAARTGPDDERTAEQRRADALVTLAAGDHPHAHVQLLVRAEHPRRAGRGLSDARPSDVGLSDARVDGEPVGPQVARRLTCDAALTTQHLEPTGNGAILGTGPQVEADGHRRLPGAALRRRLEIRDQHCAFPGCPVRARRCHAHHIRHWADGGPTTDQNLTMVCSRHHHAVHEGGWRLTGPPAELTWTDRGGRRYERPPATADITPWPEDPPLLWKPDPPPPPQAPPSPATDLRDPSAGRDQAPF